MKARFLCWVVAVVLLVGGGVFWPILLADYVTLGWVTTALAAVSMVWLLWTTPVNAIKLQRGFSEICVMCLVGAVLLAGWAWARPDLSNDFKRYLVEGAMWRLGVSPYAEAAGQFGSVDHGALKSIYPPVAQVAFFIGNALGGDYAQGLRAVMGAAAVAVVGLLMWHLSLAGRSPWWAAAVGLMPMFYVETVWNPHVDVVGVMFLLASLLMWRLGTGVRREGLGMPHGGLFEVRDGRIARSDRRRMSLAAGVLLGLACGVKPQVVLVLPFLMRGMRWRWVLAGFAAVAAGCVAVITWRGGSAGFIESMRIYSTSWEGNGGVFELIKSLERWGEDPRAINRLKDGGRLLAPVAVVVGFWILWKRGATPITAAYVLQLILLLCSPVVWPWYLMWVLCLAPLVANSRAVWIWAVTIVAAYWGGEGGRGGGRGAYGWVLWAEYLPVWVAMGWDYVRAWDGLAERKK